MFFKILLGAWVNRLILQNKMSVLANQPSVDSGSVADESVQVPKNWTCGQKFIRTGPGTARKSWSFLEPDPEPAEASSQL